MPAGCAIGFALQWARLEAQVSPLEMVAGSPLEPVLESPLEVPVGAPLEMMWGPPLEVPPVGSLSDWKFENGCDGQ